MSCEFHRFLSLSRTESRWTRRRRQASRSTRDHRRGQWSACSWVTAQPLASGRSNRSPAPSRMQISCESAISASCRPKLARYFLHQRSPSQAFQVTDPSIVYFTVNALCWKLNKVSEVCVAAVCREAYAESISVTVRDDIAVIRSKYFVNDSWCYDAPMHSKSPFSINLTPLQSNYSVNLWTIEERERELARRLVNFNTWVFASSEPVSLSCKTDQVHRHNRNHKKVYNNEEHVKQAIK